MLLGLLWRFKMNCIILDRRFIRNKKYKMELLLCKSLQKPKQILKILFSRFLWEDLPNLEVEALLKLAILEKDNLILEAFRAIRLNMSKYLVRKRVNALLLYQGRKPLSRRFLDSTKHVKLDISWEIDQSDHTIKTVYTGWRRHQNDQGSLNTSTIEYDRMLHEDFIVDEVQYFRSVLTVGYFPENPQQDEVTLMSAIKRAETVKFFSLTKEVFQNENL